MRNNLCSSPGLRERKKDISKNPVHCLRRLRRVHEFRCGAICHRSRPRKNGSGSRSAGTLRSSCARNVCVDNAWIFFICVFPARPFAAGGKAFKCAVRKNCFPRGPGTAGHGFISSITSSMCGSEMPAFFMASKSCRTVSAASAPVAARARNTVSQSS